MVILVDSPHMLMSVDMLHIYEEAGPNIILRTILTAALLAARNHEMCSFWFFPHTSQTSCALCDVFVNRLKIFLPLYHVIKCKRIMHL